jgi:phosphoserine phosphatase RsbU/P
LATAATVREGFHQLNDEFAKPENDTWFVTFVLCVLDNRAHLLSLFNAGHMAPICRRAAERVVEELGEDNTGPPLGCSPGIHYDSCTVELQPGDLVLIYTDGISEAMNAHHELYGRKRLLDAVLRGPERLEDLCGWILDDVKRFTQQHSQNDDICLIGFQREPE